MPWWCQLDTCALDRTAGGRWETMGPWLCCHITDRKLNTEGAADKSSWQTRHYRGDELCDKPNSLTKSEDAVIPMLSNTSLVKVQLACNRSWATSLDQPDCVTKAMIMKSFHSWLLLKGDTAADMMCESVKVTKEYTGNGSPDLPDSFIGIHACSHITVNQILSFNGEVDGAESRWTVLVIAYDGADTDGGQVGVQRGVPIGNIVESTFRGITCRCF